MKKQITESEATINDLFEKISNLSKQLESMNKECASLIE